MVPEDTINFDVAAAASTLQNRLCIIYPAHTGGYVTFWGWYTILQSLQDYIMDKCFLVASVKLSIM